jgi:hypothetical protein
MKARLLGRTAVRHFVGCPSADLWLGFATMICSPWMDDVTMSSQLGL